MNGLRNTRGLHAAAILCAVLLATGADARQHQQQDEPQDETQHEPQDEPQHEPQHEQAREQGPDATASMSKTVVGPRNPDLEEGARQLLNGNGELGVELTLRGLAAAQGAREHEAALSNLCAGYIMLKQYDEALKYCNLVLARNDENWRGYNNRALVYIHTKQYEKALADLKKGEDINPDARTLQIARAMYLDAVEPVTPEVEIDDRQVEPVHEDETAN